MQPTLHLGQTLEFDGNPFHAGLDAARHRRRGGVLVAEGRMLAVDEGETLRAAHPQAQVTDHGARLILPGFVDAHAHYSQTAIIASWGKRLIDWLNTYTFPEEMRFADPAHAARIAETYLDLNLANGITTAACYCTIHTESVDALMRASEARGLAMVAGKVMMDRNAPEGLRDTARSGHDDSAALIARWHGRGRLRYAITPRFAPTSTPEQLESAGALFAAHPDCAMQTHLSEQAEEIAWVRALFPQDTDYLAVYERFGLTGPGAVMGHAIHLSDREWAALRDGGTGIAHCPTSNTFIGSGLFDMDRAQGLGIPVGLATDVGGGSSFSMLRTMAAAYEVAQLRGRALHPAELVWLATAGSAEVLRLGHEIGRLAPGRMADLVILDLASTPVIAQRAARATGFWEALFPTIMLGDDRAIANVLIAGQPLRP
ncbi:guanine deaminase [Halovulum dunhuangense]|uniref:Guanine deaminase n=1 Tax=Halovulum dunhuangense TaxID=1505036 RepID=A0A849L159_9RHOB|nr:guanine deaminase [Halovulum dunhuangense]NNU79959.1 guanine deaminase [Halovulum dunhuangense]